MSLLTKKLPTLVAISLCAVVSLLAYPYLQAQVPVHWGATGSINTYADADIAVYLNPLGACVVFLFFLLIPYADRRRVGQLRRIGLYEPLRNIAVFGFSYAHCLGMGIGTGLLPDRANFLGGLAGLLLALLGWELRLPAPRRLPLAGRLPDQVCRSLGSVALVAGIVSASLATLGAPPATWLAILFGTTLGSARRAWREIRA